MTRPRLIFMGTPQFAVPSLDACLRLGEVVTVVTQPDRPKGRGHQISVSAVKARALEAGLPVLQPEKIRGTPFAGELRALQADAAVVTAYGKILPQDVLDAPRLGCVNVHASLLPRWRGAAPIQRAIEAGDTESGVSLMRLDAGMDTGPVFARRTCALRPDETGESLHDALSALGGTALIEELPGFLAGRAVLQAQPPEDASHAKRIDKSEGELDFARPAVELERRVRAFTPWPGTFTHLDGALFKVHRARVGAGHGEPGVLLSTKEGLEVACGQGSSLVLLEVQPEGRRRMGARELTAGHQFRSGDRPFGTKV